MRAQLRESVEVDVPADHLWRVVTDWPLQGRWIPFTRVSVTGGDGREVGGRLAAWTGVGAVGFLDTMVITHWSEPADGTRVCEVLHTGRVVRGDGGFEVEPLAGGRARFVWWESFEVPLGVVGAAAWRLVAPLWRVGLGKALQRLRALAEPEAEPEAGADRDRG